MLEEQIDWGELDIPAELIAAFPPSEKLLLDLVRRVVDDEMLMDIARADYGCLAEEMFRELRLIRDTGVVPVPVQGQLSEVLALTRWCDPDHPQRPPFNPGPTGVRGHQTRLFACAVLMCDPCSDNCPSATLAKCLGSARVLGTEMNEALASCLVDMAQGFAGDLSRVLLALGLLIVVARLHSSHHSETLIGRIADWVMEVEAQRPTALWWNPTNPEPIEFSVGAGMWVPFAAELNELATVTQAKDVRDKIRLCALLAETGY